MGMYKMDYNIVVKENKRLKLRIAVLWTIIILAMVMWGVQIYWGLIPWSKCGE